MQVRFPRFFSGPGDLRVKRSEVAAQACPDQVCLSEGRAVGVESPTAGKSRRFTNWAYTLAAGVGLALASMPALSDHVAQWGSPHLEQSNAWQQGLPGSDLRDNRREGIALSLADGRISADQAQQLRSMLDDLPSSGKALEEQLRRYDNLYSQYRFGAGATAPQPASGGATPVPTAASVESQQLLTHGFQIYDLNHDQQLTTAEVNRAFTSEHSQDQDADAAVSLRVNFQSMAGGSAASVTLSELNGFLSAQGGQVESSLRNSRIWRGQTPELRPLAQETFDATQITQRQQGSCVLLSALIDLPPEHLREMVHDRGDGSYLVRFRDGRSTIVQEPSEAERVFYSTTTKGERWPAIFEKATGQVLAAAGRANGDPVAAGRSVPPEEAILLLTGQPADARQMAALGPSGLRQFLIEAQSNHEPIVASVSNLAQGEGLFNRHAYSVRGFDSSTNTVYLQNPHGRGVWQNSSLDEGGRFSMPLTAFYHRFYRITAVNQE